MLEADKFVIQQRVKFLRSHDTYDLFDADTRTLIGTAEEAIGVATKALRWVVSKWWMPTAVAVRDHDGALVFTVRRGWYLVRARVEVRDANEQLVGYFTSKVGAFRGGFWAYHPDDQLMAEVKGTLGRFDFRILTPDGAEMGRVTKEWGGLAKELFTSASPYTVSVAEDLTDQPLVKMLVLAVPFVIESSSSPRTGGG